jgi:heme A synthase
MHALARFAWLVLAYNVGVIAWGAYVRATGSGAGCGNHWPLCNGAVLPRSPGIATLIEFSHRITSGLALLAVVALVIWTYRTSRRGDPARLAAALSLLFIVTEAAVGAGLVLFELVADNATMARAMFMAVHLLNTFFLLAALTMTAWMLTTGASISMAGRSGTVAAIAAGCSGLLLAGASGAVAALGDTLFPSVSVADALAADLSSSSHLLLRLRVLHPFIAVLAAIAVAVLASRLARGRSPHSARLSRTVTGLAAAQIAMGLLNVILLAPVWLQLLHLLVADAIWIGFVLLGAAALSHAATVTVREIGSERQPWGQTVKP